MAQQEIKIAERLCRYLEEKNRGISCITPKFIKMIFEIGVDYKAVEVLNNILKKRNLTMQSLITIEQGKEIIREIYRVRSKSDDWKFAKTSS